MEFASLGSGSKGNATLVRSGDTLILVDCGFTAREAMARLANAGCEPHQLTAVLVTHEHGDHAKGVLTVGRRLGVPVYMSAGTAIALKCLDDPIVRLITPEQSWVIGELEVTPIAVPHDARENCQFVFTGTRSGRRFGILTDLGHVTPHVASRFRALDALLLEANHDPDLLAAGPYPASLKRRVAGPLGHLSNAQSAELLSAVVHEGLQQVVVSHISEQNNDPELAVRTLAGALTGYRTRITLNTQDSGHAWCSIRTERGQYAEDQSVVFG